MTTDHDRIISVESRILTLCDDVKDMKEDTEVLKTFKARVEAMAALSKWQFALTFGNGCLISLVLFFHR